MKTTNETNRFDNQVVSPNSMSGGDDVRTDITTVSDNPNGTQTGTWGNAARTVALATLLTGGGSFMVSCDEPTEVVEPVDTRSETQKYTPEEWLAKTGIKAEDTPEKGLGAITMLNTPVKGNDGLYYIKPDIRLNKDVIKTLGEKVVQTSGRPIEEMHVYINFRSASALDGAQGYEKSYADVINAEGELRASQLTPNPFVTGKDMEKLYRPGSAFTISIWVQPRGDIFSQLIDQGTITVGNQQDFSQSSVFSYALAN